MERELSYVTLKPKLIAETGKDLATCALFFVDLNHQAQKRTLLTYFFERVNNDIIYKRMKLQGLLRLKFIRLLFSAMKLL